MSDTTLYLTLFSFGLKHSFNFYNFFQYFRSNSSLVSYFSLFLLIVFSVFLPSATYFDNKLKFLLQSDNSSFITRVIVNYTPYSLLQQLFVILPWNILLILVTSVTSQAIAKTRRASSPLGSTQSVSAPPKESQGDGSVYSLLLGAAKRLCPRCASSSRMHSSLIFPLWGVCWASCWSVCTTPMSHSL